MRMDGLIHKAPSRYGTRELLEWIYASQRGGIWGQEGTVAPELTLGEAEDDGWGEGWRQRRSELMRADAELRRAVTALGSAQIWAGAIPRGLHGRLVWAGMSEAAATRMVRELSTLAAEVAREVWRVRCRWSNDLETSRQKRNRWRKAACRVMNHLRLDDLTGKEAINMTRGDFAKRWRRATTMDPAVTGGEGELIRRVEREMCKIWQEQGGTLNGEGVSPAEEPTGRLYKRSKCMEKTETDVSHISAIVDKLEGMRAGPQLTNTPVGIWLGERKGLWIGAQRRLLEGWREAMRVCTFSTAEKDEYRARLHEAACGARELAATIRATSQRAVGIEMRWKRWLTTAGLWRPCRAETQTDERVEHPAWVGSAVWAAKDREERGMDRKIAWCGLAARDRRGGV